MPSSCQRAERLKQQELLVTNHRKQQQRLLTELQQAQCREISLSKKLSAIEKETMKNELITIDLLKTERDNIA